MSVGVDAEDLLDALYEHQLLTGKRPSIIEAEMKFLPDWKRDRLFDAADALEAAGDILNLSGATVYVDLSSTARKRAQARSNPPSVGRTVYNIGSVTNSPLQHVAPGGHGVQNTRYGTTADDLRAVIELYNRHVDELNLSATERQKADKAMATIQAQIVDDDPDQGIVKSAGKSLKTIIEGAIGGAFGNAITNPSVWAPVLAMF